MRPKYAGSCTLCDKEVFEVKTRFAPDHVYGPAPRQLGAALDDAWRVTLLLTDGTTCDLTFCAECKTDVPDKLPEVWRRCVEGNAFEVENIEAIKGMRIEDEAREAYRRTIKELDENVPLAVVSSLPWKEVKDILRT